MPTGYTAAVADGKVTTLADFAKSCARAFGFLIEMRDAPSDAPLPDEFKADTAHIDAEIAKARAELDEVSRLSLDECAIRANVEHAAEVRREAECDAKKLVQKDRYVAMRRKVEAWLPPSEFHGLRSFMLEQLDQSIPWDCSPSLPEFAPKLLAAAEWKMQRVSDLTKSIGRNEEWRAQEISRVAERNRYLRLFRESLAAIEVEKPGERAS